MNKDFACSGSVFFTIFVEIDFIRTHALFAVFFELRAFDSMIMVFNFSFFVFLVNSVLWRYSNQNYRFYKKHQACADDNQFY